MLLQDGVLVQQEMPVVVSTSLPLFMQYIWHGLMVLKGLLVLKNL